MYVCISYCFPARYSEEKTRRSKRLSRSRSIAKDTDDDDDDDNDDNNASLTAVPAKQSVFFSLI